MGRKKVNTIVSDVSANDIVNQALRIAHRQLNTIESKDELTSDDIQDLTSILRASSMVEKNRQGKTDDEYGSLDMKELQGELKKLMGTL